MHFGAQVAASKASGTWGCAAARSQPCSPGTRAAQAGERWFLGSSRSRKNCSHTAIYSPGERAVSAVTQPGSSAWQLSSSWQRGAWLLLFRGSGVQGRRGAGAGSGRDSRGTSSSWGSKCWSTVDVMLLTVSGAGKSFFSSGLRMEGSLGL